MNRDMQYFLWVLYWAAMIFVVAPYMISAANTLLVIIGVLLIIASLFIFWRFIRKDFVKLDDDMQKLDDDMQKLDEEQKKVLTRNSMWEQLFADSQVKQAMKEGRAVEWSLKSSNSSLRAPPAHQPGSQGWVPFEETDKVVAELFRIGIFRASISTNPAPSTTETSP